MVGPYIPITETEIVRPWPIGGFLLADCQHDWGTSRGPGLIVKTPGYPQRHVGALRRVKSWEKMTTPSSRYPKS